MFNFTVASEEARTENCQNKAEVGLLGLPLNQWGTCPGFDIQADEEHLAGNEIARQALVNQRCPACKKREKLFLVARSAQEGMPWSTDHVFGSGVPRQIFVFVPLDMSENEYQEECSIGELTRFGNSNGFVRTWAVPKPVAAALRHYRSYSRKPKEGYALKTVIV
jgi:hypothetical protein